ncbi:MAG: hypothetical protein ACRC5T_03555 [Cetobacterium sp.]
MATFTVTTAQNIDALVGKTGGDTYNINGGTLTIDQDSRNGTNQSTSTTLGPVTLSASLGGVVNIDGTAIWIIPYTGGSGNVPAWNTVITNGTGTGKLIGVHSALTAASTATGAAMPATGFIRVKQKSGAYVAGALTGITAIADNEGRVGWIEIVGDEAATTNCNRLGTYNVTGAWYEVGTTSGVSNQTMQIPNNGLLRYVAGVFIEQTVGGGDFEFYPNAGTVTTTGTEAARGKCVWIDNTGLVRIGNSGAATNGYTPVSGLRVVVGNVFFENCTTVARTANVIPNATLASRYDFTTTGGGVLNIDKCNMAWYLSCAQAYSVNVSNSGFVDGILLSEVATAMTFTKMGVGNKPTTALVVAPLTMTLCLAGGTFTDCRFQRVATTGTNSTAVIMNDCDGFTFTRLVSRCAAVRAHTLTTLSATRVNNTTFNETKIIDGQISLTTCSNVTLNNTIYISQVSGTTGTTNACTTFNLFSNCLNVTISGLTLPVTNNQPYNGLVNIGVAGCTNTKIRNIGTYASPLSLGTVNQSANIVSLAGGAAAINTRVQRVYCSGTRSGMMSADNSSKGLYFDNVFGDYADSGDVSAAINMTQRALGTTKALTAQTGVYGTHWLDHFTSTTAGRLAVVMNEPTAQTSAQVTLTNGAAFTAAGGLYMPVIGHRAIFETPDFVKGHTGFTNSALVMAGGTGTNYNYNYAINKNDGNGWSTMTVANYTPTTLGTALNGITGLNALLGFKLRLQITTTIVNATAITSVYMPTTSTTTTQAYQYALDTITLTLTGLVTASDIVVLEAGTETELVNVDAHSGTEYNFIYETPQNIDIGVFKAGYVPFYIRNYSLTLTDSSVPVAQVVDRNYLP